MATTDRRLRPRKLAVEQFAEVAGMSPAAAENYLRRFPKSPAWEARVEQLTAAAEIALADSAEMVDEVDLEDCAAEPDPMGALDDMVHDRAWRSMRSQMAANTLWAGVEDRVEHTRPAREAFMARFEREVDPEGKLAPHERARRAEYAKKAYFLRLAMKSAKARRVRKATQGNR